MTLPVYSHPSTTVLIDDSASFLQSLSFQLEPALASKRFHDTSSALAWLALHGRSDDLAVQANFDTHSSQPDQCNVAIDIDRIRRISGRAGRFSVPSVLVIDYSMPQMNGLEFCQAVRHLPCKKIMLTGAADEKIAVTAFNRGLIDRYIKKGDEAFDLLEQEITALQKDFFAAQSDVWGELLALHHYNFLADPAIARLADELSAQYGFIEHYLFPNPSGILFFDRHGKPTLMVIETVATMQAHFEVARDSDAPPSLLDALKDCSVIPFFYNNGGDGMYSSDVGSGWHRYCLAPHICQGKETYFWALSDLPPQFMQEPVYSYERFLTESGYASASADPSAAYSSRGVRR